ncbi:hypothetical protein A3Q56_05019 [Intoshia linei]|uniref:Major facilitator superfamily (MFS) profile domain-containing protein n=1 Tax=Intoshia linei TaxID=1819745 RepID=A0A177AZ20_9BILA|nr:hypothetical protein A3Q56_05019 [Intoshia linei]
MTKQIVLQYNTPESGNKSKYNIWNVYKLFHKITNVNTSNGYFVIISMCFITFSYGQSNIDIVFSSLVPQFACVDNITLINNSVMLSKYDKIFKKPYQCSNNGKGCTKYVFSDEYGYTIPVQFSLVCDQSYNILLLKLAVSLGMVASCFWSGASADRFGRKKTASICSILNIITRISSIFVTNIQGYIVIRFLMTMFNIAMFTTTFLLVIELLNIKKRFVINMTTPIMFVMGLSSLSLIYTFFNNWKTCHLYYGCVNGPICLFMLRFLKRSPSWINHDKNLDIHFTNSRKKPELTDIKRRKSSTILMIARDKTLRMKTVALYCLSFTSSAIFYGININANSYNSNLYFYLPIYNSGKIYSVICIILGIYFNAINKTYGYMLTPYQYPVSLRGSGVSFFMFSSRLGVVLGSSLYYMQTNTIIISVIYALLCLFTALLVLFHIPTISPYEHEVFSKSCNESDDSGIETSISNKTNYSSENENVPENIEEGSCLVIRF